MEYLELLLSLWGYGLFYWFLYTAAYNLGILFLFFATVWGLLLTTKIVIFWFRRNLA